jgi:hypothetical protein
MLSIFSLVLFTSSTQAQTIPEAKKPSKVAKDVVIDFDADVIEGERKVPDIFISTEIGAPNIESVVYFRKNFNDFHRLEMKSKPTYSNK